VSTRVSYWSGWLAPQMVAVSKEIFQLQSRFPGSWVFGVSPHYVCRWLPRRRAFGVNHRAYPLFRPFMRPIERWFDVSHIYTSLDDWHFVSALGTRPIVLTLTEPARGHVSPIAHKVAHVAAESERLAADARAAGIPENRVSIIYPGVDLKLFRPGAAVPSPPWRCLFASSPESPEEIRTKGVDLLLDLARERPQVEVTLAWRPFGRSSDRALRMVLDAGLPNIRIVRGRLANIHELYRSHHFTIAPFRTTGKPCPNSVLEGLASGLPALVSEFVHVAPLLERAGAAVSFQSSVVSLIAAVDRLTADYTSFQKCARPCAERYFDLENTVKCYEQLYARVASEPRSPVRPSDGPRGTAGVSRAHIGSS
jgi:glycosyltransferase involved in cell wall biosynthesis